MKITVEQHNRCATCQRNDVKLYRPYSEFLRLHRIFCSVHIPKNEYDWYVPLIEDENGRVWGYLSVPQNAITQWELLPDTDNVAFDVWRCPKL